MSLFQSKVIRINVDPNCLCRLCQKVFLSPEDLEIHRQRIHIETLDKPSEWNEKLFNNKRSGCNKKLFDNKVIKNSNHTYYCKKVCSFKCHLLNYHYKSFHCKLCKYQCYDQPGIILHVNKTHLDSKHQQFGLCDVKFDNLATISGVRSTGEKPYKCTKQDGVSNDLNSTDLSDFPEIIKQEEYLILDDPENDDPEKEIKESSGLLGLSKQNELKTKLVEITNEAFYVILNKIYRCTICPFGTKDLTVLKHHFKAHNISIVSEAPYIIAWCNEMESNLKNYQYEFCDTFYRCKICAFNCLDHELMKQHVDDFHINVTSRCEICTKFYVSALLLKVEHHHDPITRQYKCSKCEYTSFEPLTKHLMIHPNTCSECDVISSKPLAKQSDNYKTDMLYYCSLCSCKFEIMSSWHKHLIKDHPIEKQRPILILKDAQYVYDYDQKHFQCKLCEFNRSDHLKVKAHMRVHSKMKSHYCNVCGYKSAKPSNLKLHMRIHTGEKPFKCIVCDYAATQKSGLTKHMKRKHANVA